MRKFLAFPFTAAVTVGYDHADAVGFSGRQPETAFIFNTLSF